MKKFVVIGAVLIVAGVGWYLLSPLFIDKRVDEAFPTFPTPEEIAAMTPEERDQARDKALADAARMPAKRMGDAMPRNAPLLERAGKFRDVDAVHKGSGDAKLYRLPSGVHLVRLENLDIANGPDLYVYLAKHPDPGESDDVTDGGFLSLGRLKGNQGNQNYLVPTGTDVAPYRSVVIWCRLFGVLFSPAAFR